MGDFGSLEITNVPCGSSSFMGRRSSFFIFFGGVKTLEKFRTVFLKVE